MNKPNVHLSTFGQLPGLDMDKLVTPMVEILTKQPVRSVVKEFNMVSWRRDVFPSSLGQVEESKVLQSIIIFSQRFAQQTGKPIFIGGEIPLPYEMVSAIVKKLSKGANNDFLTQATDEMKPLGLTPGMVNGSQTSIRHKFMLEVFRCRSNSTWSEPTVSDCFIASKELQLTQAKMMDVEQVLGRQIQMEPLKKYAPVQTEIKYDNRPPRHHGG